MFLLGMVMKGLDSDYGIQPRKNWWEVNMVFQEDQTLGDFDKAKQSKDTSNEFIELVPIPLSLEQPKSEEEEEEIDELPRNDSASDIIAQEPIEHKE